MTKRLLFISILILGSAAARAQVIDDSTKQVYGFETTLFTTEESIKNNRIRYQVIDTSLKDMHLWEPVEREDYYYQDLGTVGTAMQPIYYQTPDVIGKRSGFSVFDYYVKEPEDFRYFDTKSPYTKLRSVIGGNYRAYIGIDFSRNVTENWNTGFSFRRWTIDKQIGPSQSRGDLNVLTHSYDIYSDYQTPNKKYRVLFNFARTFHKVNETGGIVPLDSVLIYENLFQYRDANINMRNSQAGELRQQYHVYQHYKINDLVQAYHTFDRSRRMNAFDNPSASIGPDSAFFDQYLIRTDSTKDLSQYYYVQNEIGLKGELSKLFYRFYFKRKDIRYTVKYLDVVNPLVENYGGGYVRLAPKEDWRLEASAEYELNGNYKLQSTLNIPFLEVSALSMQFASPFFYEQYLGNHDFWRNDFGSEQVQQLSGKFTFGWKDYIQLQPKAAIKVVSNHMYFDTLAMPRQGNGTATMLHPGLEFKSKFSYFHLNGDYVYTTIEGGDANLFRIPEHFLTLNLYYERNLIKNLIARFGIDAHYKTSYFADDYDPVIQQFHLQNHFEIPSYFFADVYASFKINTASFFLKMRHVNMGLNAGGYFTTPYYTGQERVFDLGVSWSFFD
ncbi:putative porin [Marivirga sp. S37H4]|uniref:Porin n=1 Tax=Marivirga aurantiaca TaxID=2802615 RepID=A0A935C8P8_9BACT|nr:putative porin [Marivirga aurantiaca]MBK6263818.1 putative porin [Marivirga aurantiaca]